MKVTAMVVAGLITSTLVAGGPAHAEVTAQPPASQFFPLQPSPSPGPDAKGEVQELLRQVNELDDSWDSLSPAERNRRIAGLQQQVTVVQRDANNLPPDQQPEVQGMLSVAALRLANILRKQLSSG